MKLSPALTLLAFLPGALLATSNQEKTVKKHAPSKEHKKHTATKKSHTSHTAHHTKKQTTQSAATGHKKLYAAQDRPAQATTAQRTATPAAQSTTSKLGRWLGLNTAATTAATAAGTAGLMRNASGNPVHHRGPRDWKGGTPAGGWVGKQVGNTWHFANHTLEWWKENHPAYYTDVVMPEYRAFMRK